MKIGDHYDIARVDLADWHSVAKSRNVPEDDVSTWLSDMIRALPDHISAAGNQAIKDGLRKAAIASLTKQLIAHVKERAKALVK